ncbi:DUF3459 domain-containing protein [Calidifontibacter sp. DB0510]|uniref:DUF3459 domain-containing protein n=1 Tax=Metallococcus carri TaxID=1656884 RepID=A0A967EHT9_9MICO|nr:alpha-amylase family protein [Metallococcus carri]NHN57063.1 DUF3459 domain-containing protein [Metallococcus carri]NOP39068.1 DUF3459 domain-containing protein [Calidifontibacter sp. DB2511S]
MAAHREPEWVEHALWWHVYPLGFLGADTTGAVRSGSRTLRDLIPWLDYVQALGLNGIALGPIFESATHGYDTRDYFRIDSRLGSEEDFAALVAACRERGLRIQLDGVFNHIAADHPDAGGLTTGSSFEGHDRLAELDHSSPDVVRLVQDVMVHWLARGADSWRLDAAYAVPPAFWSQVLPAVREQHPDAYVMGEVIHGDYPAIVSSSGMDSVTQYELWKAIWSGLRDQNLFELAHALQRHNTFLDTFVPWTFTGNHDVTRLATQLDGDALLPHALVVLMTVGGTPAIYYGDEQAFRGLKEEREGGDDAIRPQFPSAPGELAAEGEWMYRLHQELIGLRRRHPWLHRARVEQLSLANTTFAYRAVGENESLIVALSIGDDPITVSGGELLCGNAAQRGDQFEVAPGNWAVLTPPAG